MIFIYMFTLTNVELFRSLFVFGIRVGGRGRFCRSSTFFLTSSLRTPKFFVKEFSYFLMPCHQHGLRINLLVQR